VTTANCPSCGALIEFAIGSSEVVVCSYCKSIVARTDRGLELHGKVAALIDTGSPLQRGVTGKYRGVGFRITGRTQLRHQAGGVWDEWYAALDDGRWLWLAEAQGRFYVTFKVAAEAPPRGQLQLGGPALDGMTVAEIGTAELLSAEGELPWTPDAGSSYEYADLTSADRRFATIDYSEVPPVVFKGVETTLQDLGIAGEPARRTRVATTALNCPNCGGALELRAPDQTERIWCPYCGGGSDVNQGKLTFFKKLKKSDVQPIIPLGTTGTIDGDSYVVAGFMERAVHFDRDYFWTEYLLYNREKGFRWLVHSDEHWSFVTPLRPGEVADPAPLEPAKRVHYNGRDYKLFQDASARVTHVIGEFYWKVSVGEKVNTVDWVCPPFGISKEITTSGAQEIAYSHARYMTGAEVQEAFKVEGLNRPVTVGPMQPYTGPKLLGVWMFMLALLLITAIAMGVLLPGKVVFTKDFDLTAEPPVAGGPDNARISFSEPFELSGAHNLEIRGSAAVSDSWLYAAGDLVNEATGSDYAFEFPLEFYSGYEDGEHWTEGRREKTVHLGRPEKGRYTLRLESQWEAGKVPPPVRIVVREGVFRWPYFIVAFLVISVFPILAVIRQAAFESERWKDSAHSPFAAMQSGGEEEDDEEE
jgi:DNA-directed RNA polymerase subunit RPC12/RpoP